MSIKFHMWTVSYIDSKGVHSFIECESRSAIKNLLEEMKTSGQDMDYVNIFPPNSRESPEDFI